MCSDWGERAVSSLNAHFTADPENMFSYRDMMDLYYPYLHVSSPWAMFDGDFKVEFALDTLIHN